MGFFEHVRSALMVFDLAAEVDTTLRVTERLLPKLERVHCLCLPDVRDELDTNEGHTGTDLAHLERSFQRWRRRRPQLQVSYSMDAGLNAATVAKLADELSVNWVVLSPFRAHSTRDRAGLVLRLSARHLRHVLSIGENVQKRPRNQPFTRRVALAVDVDAAALPSLAVFVSELPKEAAVTALAMGASEVRRQEIAAMFQARDPQHPVDVHAVPASSTNLSEVLDAATRDMAADLVVGAADSASDVELFALGLFAGSALQEAACPILVLPRTREAPLYLKEHLVASDAVLGAHVDPRVAVERVGAFGRIALDSKETLTVIERGTEHPPLPHDDGLVTLPRGWFGGDTNHPVVLESRATTLREDASARLLRPDRPLVLLEALVEDLPMEALAAATREFQVVFVRMRRSDDLGKLRERLGAHGAAADMPYVIDAGAWLDDGGAEDVPSLVDGQRLLRVALQMMACGIAVQAVISREQHLRTRGCVALTVSEWRSLGAAALAGPRAVASEPMDTLERVLDLCTGSTRTAGHSVRLEFDNASARKAVLRLIADARERVHWQCYIVEDDATSAEFAEALSDAAKRGVQVRFLADAVYSLHQAFGQRNNFLAQLAHTPGIRVHAYRPVVGVPNLSALKRRNHRKCIVIDGSTGVVTGRNLGAPYYRGFHEVKLHAASPYREVPWLDCGAILQGPLVSELEAAFSRDWQAAGGDAYSIAPSPARGSLTGRLVLHEGLRDTHTFDAQLALIRHAHRELVVVNNFPLVVELQKAFLAAIQRGVKVKLLFGSVRPHFGDDESFAGGTIRSLADQLVRSRLDAIAQAGGEIYEYAIDALPEWDPQLGRVFPHVHAKLLTRDGTDVAIGSANLDVTAAYWESEVLLIIHDPTFAQDVNRELASLFASARAVDPSSERFRSESSQRSWLSRYWPSLIG